MQPRRRQTRELPPVTLAGTETGHDGEARCTTVAIDGVAVIDTPAGVEIRADGQLLRVSSAQAWAIAAAVLELTRLRDR